jgi:hypothetical protein
MADYKYLKKPALMELSSERVLKSSSISTKKTSAKRVSSPVPAPSAHETKSDCQFCLSEAEFYHFF